jgi:hypothetical protein
LTLAYTNYSYQTEFQQNGTNLRREYIFRSEIKDLISKAEIEYTPSPKHTIRIGKNNTYHYYSPGTTRFIQKDISNTDSTTGAATINALEGALYIEDKIIINKRISGNIGTHFSYFAVNNQWFKSLQPRASMNITLPESFAIKSSFSTMQQYVHLLSNSGTGIPTDLWVPSTAVIPPSLSSQITLGLVKTLGEANYEISIEGYRKKMKGLIDFKEGVSMVNLSSEWQNKVEVGGTGLSYGVEFLVNKKTGRNRGWIAYTLSRSTRHFPNINNNEPYLFRYDRRHDLSIAWILHLNQNISFSSTWIYASGTPITLATGKGSMIDRSNLPLGEDYFFYFYDSHIYEGRNKFKMRDYHRLDIGVNFRKTKKRGERNWNLSVFNVYNRQNPFFYYYKYEGGRNVLYQQSYFSFIPSVSYSYKFK